MTPVLVLVGGLSMYHPGDGHNRGRLACGDKRFTWNQRHIAIRQWRRVGCGALARVCLLGSGREKAVYRSPGAADGWFNSTQLHQRGGPAGCNAAPGRPGKTLGIAADQYPRWFDSTAPHYIPRRADGRNGAPWRSGAHATTERSYRALWRFNPAAPHQLPFGLFGLGSGLATMHARHKQATSWPGTAGRRQTEPAGCAVHDGAPLHLARAGARPMMRPPAKGERCVWTTVEDSGPWGAVRGKRWEVQIRLKPGWRRRGVVDLSWALWREMGRPRFLARVRVEVYRYHGAPR